MKIKFKNQAYQDDAVRSLLNCFIGQKYGTRRELIYSYKEVIGDGIFAHEEEKEVISYGNHDIILTDLERAKNIRAVQEYNDISYSKGEPLDEFSIEMETGTGKTFTYIKSMYELNKEYGWSKFIIMVPSIAIREGVQKSFDITEDYFQEIYHKKIRYFVYNSALSSNISNINTFASDDSIQVMIINYQAFNGKSTANKKIYEELDDLQSRRPIDVIKSVRPILIIDEPQKFGDKTEELFQEFDPLFKVRYSATHKKNKEYNKIYKLDAIDAYNEKLVKKINVKGVELLHGKSENTYMFLDSINLTEKFAPEAIMEIEVKSVSGVNKKLIKLKINDDLYKKSGELSQYKGYVVSEINGRYDEGNKVKFVNGEEIEVGQVTGNVDEIHLIRIQIRETIKSHLEKEKEFYGLGIKVLSLFFIDEVAKYKYYEGSKALKGDYAKIFEEEYNKAILQYTNSTNNYAKYLNSFETGKIHAGYFSIDKSGHEINPNINDRKEYLSFDEDAYDLIMRDKERLLSLEEPVRFIFSHSALREGWDNPNIFQICTLKHSNSEISKRQEIGRGLRICVNSEGERMDYTVLENDFHTINTLTVVASESYDSFASSLQTEIATSLTDRPKNFTQEAFRDKVLINENGEIYKFSAEHFQDLLLFNVMNGYVDPKNNYNVTDKFMEDMENDKLEVIPELVGFKDQLSSLMKKLYLSNNTVLVNDERKENIKCLVPNENFNKKEFQELWNKINIKTAYEVNFDTKKLIEKAVLAINNNLNIEKMVVRITEGEQNDNITSTAVYNGSSMTLRKTKHEVVDNLNTSLIKYDLVGEIAKDTGLIRKTIIEILSKINSVKFAYYKYNPEEFIRKVSNLINVQKALIVVDGITYHKLDDRYSDDIFNVSSTKGKLGENAIFVKKHIYNYLITDSKVEMEFAKKLEIGEVSVYAKLPRKFKIPTPLGSYNPDWAIVLNNPKYKHVYFIAETKGSTDEVKLRGIEDAKIACARKHFECICDESVVYDIVDSYEMLISKAISM